MKILNINGEDYKLEYSFEAAEHKDTVQKMFNMLTGAYVVKQGVTGEEEKEVLAGAMIDGVSEMVADTPHVVKTAFYAGLLENNPVSQEEAKLLMRAYMKENKISYKQLFDDIKECMEDDGFFDLSGLTDMIREMVPEEKPKKVAKMPQDHKKKSTSTK